jgi:dTDP-glucose 4,6-dehydratase
VLDLLTYAGTRTNLAGCDVEFVHGDIRDADTVARVLDGADVVVHFAAESHVDRSIAGAADFVSTNVVGTQVLLAGALAAGVDRFVHVSTDEVYGSIEEGAWSESHPLQPNSPYSASKAGSDLLARAYHRTHGLPVCITRCSNNYGPHQFPEKVIPLFVTNLLDGRKVPLYGDGLNVRDWLHVDDHCRGIQLVAEKGRDRRGLQHRRRHRADQPRPHPPAARRARRAAEMIEPVADRLGHDRRYCVDWSKIADELGYAPRVPFDEGLAATVAWYRDRPRLVGAAQSDNAVTAAKSV